MSPRIFPWSATRPRRALPKKKGAPRIRAVSKTLACCLAALLALNLLVIGLLRWLPVPFSAFMLRDRAAGHAVAYRWTSWDKLPPDLAMAVIASEDQRFPDHWGFDFRAIAEALDEERKRLRGASTISQQVAKNLFLWPGHSWVRKGLEAYLTVLIEICWPKRRILEVYLNIAQFGPGVYGADAAARRYYSRPPWKLTRREAALMAAVLPNPVELHIRHASAYVRERAAHIEEQISLLGGARYLKRIRQ